MDSSKRTGKKQRENDNQIELSTNTQTVDLWIDSVVITCERTNDFTQIKKLQIKCVFLDLQRETAYCPIRLQKELVRIEYPKEGSIYDSR